MTKLRIILLSLFCVTLFASFEGNDANECDTKALKDKARKAMEPYKFDAAKLMKISNRAGEYMKELEVPLFIGESYRFVFNAEALKTPIGIEIYNKDKDNKHRKLLFSSKEGGADKKEFVWNYENSTKVYIDYTIPAGTDGSFNGCLLFMLGYK
ncbi:MAG: hypothetical protein ACHQRM_11910 [Bacteroidia bacterium]